jgi:hypothetical protein
LHRYDRKAAVPFRIRSRLRMTDATPGALDLGSFAAPASLRDFAGSG